MAWIDPYLSVSTPQYLSAFVRQQPTPLTSFHKRAVVGYPEWPAEKGMKITPAVLAPWMRIPREDFKDFKIQKGPRQHLLAADEL